ncbi:MAG: carboxylesterase family protein [Pseudomonadota bacterium]
MSRLLRAAASGLALGLASAAAATTLVTPQGELQGELSPRSGEVRVFKHIPYAKPPLGERRWRHAEAAPAWQGIRRATDFSPACMQPPYPSESFYARAAAPTSEDCLYLNVWSPVEAKRLPVMVWIHGGALRRGSGSSPFYDGTELAKKGVVLVTINYRLGVFGYLTHAEAAGEANGASGNYGLSDQVMALNWVRDNIAAFGGNPENVTIFGESAGSWSVFQLVASPQAKGLFHRAIGQSGARFDYMRDVKTASREGDALQDALGVESLAELRRLDAAAVLAAAPPGRLLPTLDGLFFKEQLFAQFAAGRHNLVPTIVGYTKDEGTTLGAMSRAPKDSGEYETQLKKIYPQHLEAMLAAYPSSTPRASWLAAFRDGSFGWGMRTWALHNSTAGADTYLYRFDHAPFGEPLGAYHAAEIPYVFNNTRYSERELTKRDHQLAELMSDYWVSFAENGKPRVRRGAPWRGYNRKARQHVAFDAPRARRGKGLMDESYAVWSDIRAAERRAANR